MEILDFCGCLFCLVDQCSLGSSSQMVPHDQDSQPASNYQSINYQMRLIG